jgi:arginine-tRNA-protein transferase
MDPLIFEELHIEFITPIDMDQMLAEGWRHFGAYFFRYNMNIYKGQLCNVIPLRICLEDFNFSKSQRKIINKGKGFNHKIQPVKITKEQVDLFNAHKTRFEEGAPNSIHDFLSDKPDKVPGKANELLIYDGDKLIAASYFDLGRESISSIYGMFDLDYGKHSLGIYTMLIEIEYAIRNGYTYYYHGYCYDVSSFYDYKKRFTATEFYNWKESWHDYKP